MIHEKHFAIPIYFDSTWVSVWVFLPLNSSHRILFYSSAAALLPNFWSVHNCTALLTPYCRQFLLTFTICNVIQVKRFLHKSTCHNFPSGFCLHKASFFFCSWFKHFPWIILGEFNMQVFPIDIHCTEYFSQFFHFSHIVCHVIFRNIICIHFE